MKLSNLIKKKNELEVLVRRIKVIQKITRNCEYETCKKYLLASEATENNTEYYDFEFFDLGGTIYNDNGKARLCENLTLYSRSGTPIKDIEL